MSTPAPSPMRKLIDERLVTAIIMINAISVFLRAFPDMPEGIADVVYAVDYACTLYFLLELVIKLRLLGPKRYIASGWNRFDLLVVLIGLPMLLSPWFESLDLAFLLVLRIARPLRSFRMLRFVPEGDRLWQGIKRGLKASIGVALTMAMYNFVLSLAACYIFGRSAPDQFGDPFISMYSMFKVFTVEGWYEIPDLIAQGSTPGMGVFARFYFVFSVTTGGLLGLSMANAVFIDEMAMDNNDDLEADVKALRDEIKALREENQRATQELHRAITGSRAPAGED